MRPPLAYFLTWTCYGTWLHGDDRGSVDRWNNAPGAPPLPADPVRETIARRAMRHDPTALADDARRIVADAVADHCRLRGWELLAINVRTNHVHVVVSCPPDVSPEHAMTEFKLWSTRRLRLAGVVPSPGRVWTRHGSTRWINNEEVLNAAMAYVIDGQTNKADQDD